MVSIPLFLVDIEVDRPIVWNGKSLTLSDVTYTDLQARIKNLQANGNQLSTMVNKMRLDLGLIRKFDLFDLEGGVRLLEREIVKIIPMLDHYLRGETNLDSRTETYELALATLNRLREEYAGLADSMLSDIRSKESLVESFRRKLIYLSSSVDGMNAKTLTFDSTLSSVNNRLFTMGRDLGNIYSDIVMIQGTIYHLSKADSESRVLIGIIEKKTDKATSDAKYLSDRICDFALRLYAAFNDIGLLNQQFDEAYQRMILINPRLDNAQIKLNNISSSLNLLRDYYYEADAKLTAIENYLTAFIKDGNGIHLDFGLDYTVINAIAPEQPPCLEPLPCPTTTTTTTAKPLVININDTSVAEGSAGQTSQLCWTVSLEPAQETAVTVDYDVVGGTAASLAAKGRIMITDKYDNPVVAVVDQEGVGKVVFDGGFPKFYNQFYGKTNTFVYLKNVANWSKKAGNNNALLLMDYSKTEYNLGTGGSSFGTGIPNTLKEIGLNPSSAYITDMGSRLTREYLNRFGFIVFIFTQYAHNEAFHNNDSATNLANWVRDGGGLFVITDHAPNFQGNVNVVSRRFGIEFFGNVNRQNMSIDEAISKFGDHPLWTNMRGQNLIGGGSEGSIRLVDTGYDFDRIKGKLTSNPGETSKQLCTNVYGNNVPNPNKTVEVGISNPSSGSIVKNVGIGTILDDDGGGGRSGLRIATTTAQPLQAVVKSVSGQQVYSIPIIHKEASPNRVVSNTEVNLSLNEVEDKPETIKVYGDDFDDWNPNHIDGIYIVADPVSREVLHIETFSQDMLSQVEAQGLCREYKKNWQGMNNDFSRDLVVERIDGDYQSRLVHKTKRW